MTPWEFGNLGNLDFGNQRRDGTMRKLNIIIDTREQEPLDFGSHTDVAVSRAKLWPGDYGLRGAPNLCAIERKSVSDLIGTLMTAYAGSHATSPKRFDCELKALKGISLSGGKAMILVEPDDLALRIGNSAEEQILAHHYRSAISPEHVMAFVACVRDYWHVPVVFAASRTHAAEIVYHTLRAVDSIRQCCKAADADILAAIEGARSAPRVSDDKSTAQTAPSDSRGV